MCARSRADATNVEWKKKTEKKEENLQNLLSNAWCCPAGWCRRLYCTPVRIILFESAHAIFIIHFASLFSQFHYYLLNKMHAPDFSVSHISRSHSSFPMVEKNKILNAMLWVKVRYKRRIWMHFLVEKKEIGDIERDSWLVSIRASWGIMIKTIDFQRFGYTVVPARIQATSHSPLFSKENFSRQNCAAVGRQSTEKWTKNE